MSLEDLFASTGLIAKEEKPKKEKKPRPKRERKQVLSDTKILEELKALRNSVDALKATINSMGQNTIDEATIQSIAKSIAGAVMLQIRQNIVNVVTSAVQDALSRTLVDPETIAKSIADAIREQVSQTNVVDPVAVAREIVRLVRGEKISILGKFPKQGRYRKQILSQAKTLEEKIVLLLFFKNGGAQIIETARLLEADKHEVHRLMRSMKQQGKLAKRRPAYRYVLNMRNPEIQKILRKYIDEEIIKQKMEIFEKELRSGMIIL